MNTTAQRVTLQFGTCSSIDGPVILSYPSKAVEYFVSDVIACMVNITLTLTNVLLNCVMIIAYSKSSQLKKHLSYFLVAMLSCIDLAIGGVGNSMFTVFLFTKLSGNRNCQLAFGFIRCLFILSGMSIAVLSSMNIERYLAIVHPLIHRTKLTKKRLLLLAVILWSLFMVAFFVSFASQDTAKNMVLSYRLCLSVLTIGTYVKIFLAVRKSKMYRNGVSTNNKRIASSESSSNVKKKFLKELKLAKSSILILMSNFICSLPQLMMTGMVHDEMSLHVMDIYTTWIGTTVTLNSSLNSVLYFWLNPRLKNDSMTIVKQIFSKV